MAYFINGYPYSDTHNLNLDWVIDTLKRIETEMGQLHDGLEIHVTGNDGTELYTFTVKANGVYITRPDGGTPLFYNFESQTLHAPYFDGQSFLFASGRTTGQMRAGNLMLDNALPVAQGGTGSTNAAGARNALGAMASDAVIPISQGGTGATNADDAREALRAVNKAGDTMTGALTTPRVNLLSSSYPVYWYMTDANTDVAYHGLRLSDRRFVIAYRNGAGISQQFSLPPLSGDTSESTWYDILTSKNPVTVAQGGTGMTGPVGITLTPGSNVSLARASSKTWGKLVVLNFVITVSASISSGGVLLTTQNMPAPNANTDVAMFTSTGGVGLGIINSGATSLIANATISAGTYFCNATFMVN